MRLVLGWIVGSASALAVVLPLHLGGMEAFVIGLIFGCLGVLLVTALGR